MIMCNTSEFDAAMFKQSWRRLVSAIAYAFTMSAGDDHVIQKSITGFRQCAFLASHFQVPEVFDTIVQSLAIATGLLEDRDDSNKTNYPVIEKDGQNLTVSPLSIRFGQSYRAQLATVVLFTIANGNGEAIREGWMAIFEMFTTLFLHSLLPPQLLLMEDFLAGTTTIPMKVAAPTPAPERRPEGGLLSTLSSYLLSPYGNAAEENISGDVGEEDLERTLVAIDCLASCKLEELYAEILCVTADSAWYEADSRSLEIEALIPALQAIRYLAEQRTTAKLSVKTEVRSETGSPILVQREGQLGYDPASVFQLETMVSLACRGRQHIAETWYVVPNFLSLADESGRSSSSISRLCLDLHNLTACS